jgi:hypothetical protein
MFEGDGRLNFKRGKHVLKKNHWMQNGTEYLIEAFGFEHPAMNAAGYIDAVVTDSALYRISLGTGSASSFSYYDLFEPTATSRPTCFRIVKLNFIPVVEGCLSALHMLFDEQTTLTH